MDQNPPLRYVNTAEHLFAEGGETGAHMQAIDWSQTPLGPVDTWPQVLRTALRICLTSRHPMCILWGAEFRVLYNDAFAPVLGQRNPWAIGQPKREVWPEVWDLLRPILERVLTTGQATWSYDQLLLTERYGYSEEAYFTYSFSPLEDTAGRVGGIFTAVTETTARVLGERRTRAARELAAATADARTVEEVYQQAAEVLEAHAQDVPFALFYRLDPRAGVAHLAARAGLVGETPLSPAQQALSDESACWPLQAVLHTHTAQLVTGLGNRWGAQTIRAGRDLAPQAALVCPVQELGQARPSAILVAGISPRRALDEDYRHFYEVVVSHLSRALAGAHAQEEERRRAESLAELDRAKTLFFSNVSHEFRTPLTLILGPLEDLLRANQLPPNLRPQVEGIQRNGLRLLKLVNTLLDFSRIEAGRAQAVYVPTDLAALTTQLASMFQSLMEQAGLRFLVECPRLAESVYVDRDLWEKIVLNLLSNAFKFTFTGEIAVTLRQEEHQVRLRVRDTGIGIPPEELSRLFERFHRVQGARARTYEGSGIGLALVQELVCLHGGTISVESQVGVGTVFTITLPLGTAHLPADRIQASRTQGPTALGAALFLEEARRWLADKAPADEGMEERLCPAEVGPRTAALPVEGTCAPPRRILLADDNADLRDYATRLLGERYEVVAVNDGAAALAAARADPPDLVLADVMMPTLDGFGLLRALRADPALHAIPVVLLSARAGGEATIEGLEAGADDYLIKPFSARELLARVATHLDLAHLRQQAIAQAAQLTAIFEAVTDGLLVYDQSGQLLQFNTAGRAFLPLDQESGSPPRPLEERLRLKPLLTAEGQLLTRENWLVTCALRGEVIQGASAPDLHVWKNGQEQVVTLTAAPIYTAAGVISGAVLVCRDVTERRALERRTQEALATVLQLVETVVPGQALGEPRERLQQIVDATRRVFGCELASLVQIDPDTRRMRPLVTSGLTAEETARWREGVGASQLDQYYTPEQLHRAQQGEIVIPDQEEVARRGLPVIGRGGAITVPLLDQGRLVGMLTIGYRGSPPPFSYHDTSLLAGLARLAVFLQHDRLLRERAAAEARVLALEETRRRMDEFLILASHELRTPLTVLLGTTQLVERATRAWQQEDLPATLRGSVERYQRLLDQNQQNLARLMRLVEDLLEVSRLSADPLALHCAPCDLGVVLHDALEAQRAAWPDRQILLRTPEDRPLKLTADAGRLGQVVINLLTNALKYSPPDQPVEVEVQHIQTGIRVAMCDHGPGLTKEQQAHLFERFFRVPGIEPQSGSGVGLGLGLYICKTIIEGHQGQIGVDSHPGQGSTFWFTLPRPEEADQISWSVET